MIAASITVTRFNSETEEEIEIDVELSGQTEYFGSANPYERGVHIADWSVDSPKGFDLTPAECVMAEEALEHHI